MIKHLEIMKGLICPSEIVQAMINCRQLISPKVHARLTTSRDNEGTLKLKLFPKESIRCNSFFASLPRFGCFENIVLVVFKFLYAFSDIIQSSMFAFLYRGVLVVCVNDDI